MTEFVENVDGTVTPVTKTVKPQDDFTLENLQAYYENLTNYDDMEVD